MHADRIAVEFYFGERLFLKWRHSGWLSRGPIAPSSLAAKNAPKFFHNRKPFACRLENATAKSTINFTTPNLTWPCPFSNKWFWAYCFQCCTVYTFQEQVGSVGLIMTNALSEPISCWCCVSKLLPCLVAGQQAGPWPILWTAVFFRGALRQDDVPSKTYQNPRTNTDHILTSESSMMPFCRPSAKDAQRRLEERLGNNAIAQRFWGAGWGVWGRVRVAIYESPRCSNDPWP